MGGAAVGSCGLTLLVRRSRAVVRRVIADATEHYSHSSC